MTCYWQNPISYIPRPHTENNYNWSLIESCVSCLLHRLILFGIVFHNKLSELSKVLRALFKNLCDFFCNYGQAFGLNWDALLITCHSTYCVPSISSNFWHKAGFLLFSQAYQPSWDLFIPWSFTFSLRLLPDNNSNLATFRLTVWWHPWGTKSQLREKRTMGMKIPLKN